MKKKIKILCVNPWVTDFSLYDFWIKPIGLLYIAGILEEQRFRVFFLDLLDRHNPFLLKNICKKELKKIKDKKFSTGKFPSREIEKPEIYKKIPRKYKLYGWPEEISMKYLKNIAPDLILMTTGMTYWYPGVLKTFLFLKEIYSNIPVIIGGRYVYLCEKHARKLFIKGNSFICKEIEFEKILMFIEKITGHKLEKEKYRDLKNLPLPYTKPYPVIKHFPYISSFGCPFKCAYCASKFLFPVFREIDVDKVVKDIKYLSDIGVKDIAFYDDALLYPPERAKEMFRKLSENSLRARFHTPNAIHARYVDSEMAKLIRDLNFKTIRIGFESINDQKLKERWSLKSDRDIFEKAIYNLKKAGFNEEIGAYVLIGSPEDNFEEIIKSYEFLFENNIKIYPAQFSPIPGTDYFNEELDPLYSNKSVYFLGNKDFSFEIYEKIKDFAKVLNNYTGKEKFITLYKEFFKKN